MTMTETAIAITWITTAIAADLTLPSLATLAPGGVSEEIDVVSDVYPKIIVRFQGGSYKLTQDGRIVFLNALYAVYGIWGGPGIASYGGALETIAVRLRGLLHKQTYQTADGLVLASIAETPLKLPVLRDGVSYRALGDVYRIWSQQ